MTQRLKLCRPHRRIPTIAVLGFLLPAFCFHVGSAQESRTENPSGSSANGARANPLSLEATPPDIKFDAVLFKRCPPDTYGTTKVDMPMNGDYLAYHCEVLSRLIYFAYESAFQPYSLAHTYPKWVDDDHYEFVAKVAAEDIAAWQKLDLPGRRLVMRTILADKVKLKVQLLSTPEPIYALVVGKRGAKLKPYKEGDRTKLPDGLVQTAHSGNWVGSIAYFQDYTLTELAELLTSHFDLRIVDRTNLAGEFNFSVPVPFGGGNNPFTHFPTEDSPSTSEGLEDLGLRLEHAIYPVDRLQVVQIERPEEN